MLATLSPMVRFLSQQHTVSTSAWILISTSPCLVATVFCFVVVHRLPLRPTDSDFPEVVTISTFSSTTSLNNITRAQSSTFPAVRNDQTRPSEPSIPLSRITLFESPDKRSDGPLVP